MTIEEIIHEIKQLDLKRYPIEELEDLLKQVDVLGQLVVTYHTGNSIIRARPNMGNEIFSKVSDLSFKPQEFNNYFQRASTPKNTMYYGCVIPNEVSNLNFNARIGGLLESLPWVRDNQTIGYQKITYGRWEAISDLNLVAIIHDEKYIEQNNYLKELRETYNSFLKTYSKEEIEQMLILQSFISNEFSKNVEQNNDYEYLISSLFTKIILEQNPHIDGIIYPSVRSDGKGFNICIKPESCDKIKLYAVGECTILKNKQEVAISNDNSVEIDIKQSDFKIIRTAKNYTPYLHAIGLKYFDQLKKIP